MEFNEKLQKLRKEKGLTQEELAGLIFVSRTAVSKWEAGRGLPNIESLKALSKVFSVTIDELLSGEEIIRAAEEDKKDNTCRLRMVIFGIIDLMSLLFFVVPIFGNDTGNRIEMVSLFSLTDMMDYILAAYYVILGASAAFGAVELALQNVSSERWRKYQTYISLALTLAATVQFILTREPYAAFFELGFLVLKGAVCIGKK